MSHAVLVGDVAEVLPTLEPDSFDAVLCDPPYGLEFMGKDWDAPWEADAAVGQRWQTGLSPVAMADGAERLPRPSFEQRSNVRCRGCGRWRLSSNPCACAAPDFPNIRLANMEAFQAWTAEWGRAAYRVAKPGAVLLAFGGTRTHHRLTCGLEEAGWEVRDCLMWLHGQGFPKSLDISKALDKAAGAEREAVGVKTYASGGPERYGTAPTTARGFGVAETGVGGDFGAKRTVTAPATEAARRWSGYGTALKPAWEPCLVAMKPLDGTYASNAEKWGVAGLNVDGCRVQAEAGANLDGGRVSSNADGWDRPWKHDVAATAACRERGAAAVAKAERLGRWPANVLLDEDAARQLDEQSGERKSGTRESGAYDSTGRNAYGEYAKNEREPLGGSTGGASRFFYTAKVSPAEREGSDHPTMKPIDLMRYLATLVLPPQRETPRRLLVPFAGVGSEMIGAILAGWDEVVGVEKDATYAAKARERIVGTAPLFLEAR